MVYLQYESMCSICWYLLDQLWDAFLPRKKICKNLTYSSMDDPPKCTQYSILYFLFHTTRYSYVPCRTVVRASYHVQIYCSREIFRLFWAYCPFKEAAFRPFTSYLNKVIHGCLTSLPPSFPFFSKNNFQALDRPFCSLCLRPVNLANTPPSLPPLSSQPLLSIHTYIVYIHIWAEQPFSRLAQVGGGGGLKTWVWYRLLWEAEKQTSFALQTSPRPPKCFSYSSSSSSFYQSRQNVAKYFVWMG